jgi:hypothetical protein
VFLRGRRGPSRPNEPVLTSPAWKRRAAGRQRGCREPHVPTEVGIAVGQPETSCILSDPSPASASWYYAELRAVDVYVELRDDWRPGGGAGARLSRGGQVQRDALQRRRRGEPERREASGAQSLFQAAFGLQRKRATDTVQPARSGSRWGTARRSSRGSDLALRASPGSRIASARFGHVDDGTPVRAVAPAAAERGRALQRERCARPRRRAPTGVTAPPPRPVRRDPPARRPAAWARAARSCFYQRRGRSRRRSRSGTRG